MIVKYYPINNYTVHCRLYPNKTQSEQIDNLIDAARLFHNNTLYDILVNKNPDILREVPDKNNPDKHVHFIKFEELKKAKYINKQREKDPRINRLPGSAISGKVGLVTDMQKAWKKTGKHPIENFDQTYKDKEGNEITIGISYYSSKKQRRSYSYQTVTSNIIPTDNDKVYKIKLSSRNYPVDGYVKIKGFNNNLRFDEKCEMTFPEWLVNYKLEIRVTITKDNCGDYWLNILLPLVYKPIREHEIKSDLTGVDVGEIDIMTIYNDEVAKKYGNLKEANKRFNHEQDGEVLLNKRLSRQEGWKNIDFRNRHKLDNTLKVSKNYSKTELTYSKLRRKQIRQRKDFESKAVADLIGLTNNIAIEGLRVKDLIERKPKQSKNAKK